MSAADRHAPLETLLIEAGATIFERSQGASAHVLADAAAHRHIHPVGNYGFGIEERLTELVDDPGSAELREWIVGRPRRDDRVCHSPCRNGGRGALLGADLKEEKE